MCILRFHVKKSTFQRHRRMSKARWVSHVHANILIVIKSNIIKPPTILVAVCILDHVALDALSVTLTKCPACLQNLFWHRTSVNLLDIILDCYLLLLLDLYLPCLAIHQHLLYALFMRSSVVWLDFFLCNEIHPHLILGTFISSAKSEGKSNIFFSWHRNSR